MAQKYKVHKMADWQAYRNGLTAQEVLRLPKDVPDAEVIRHQDITSPGMFWQYASSIQQLIETVELLESDFDIASLEEIRQHFRDAAMAAEQVAHKIPD